MELDETRDVLVRSMALVETAGEKLEPLHTCSDEELMIKQYISEEIKTLIADQLILVDKIYQVQEIIEDGTGMETVGDILANNEPVN